jgi:hypothetical protein
MADDIPAIVFFITLIAAASSFPPPWPASLTGTALESVFDISQNAGRRAMHFIDVCRIVLFSASDREDFS